MYQGLGNSRLPYKVLNVSSQDPAHPVHSIQADYSLSIENKSGWLSRKFCDYPQILELQFQSPVRLKTMQLLSHEHMISSRVEINFLPSDAVSAQQMV